MTTLRPLALGAALLLLATAPAAAQQRLTFDDVDAFLARAGASTDGKEVLIKRAVVAGAPRTGGELPSRGTFAAHRSSTTKPWTEPFVAFDVAPTLTVHAVTRRWESGLLGYRTVDLGVPEVSKGDTVALTGTVRYDAATKRFTLTPAARGVEVTAYATPRPRLTLALVQGDMIAITGADLALTPAERSGLRVIFQPGGLEVPAVTVNATTIVAPIPALFEAGQVLVEVPGRGRSNAVLYARPSGGLAGTLR